MGTQLLGETAAGENQGAAKMGYGASQQLQGAGAGEKGAGSRRFQEYGRKGPTLGKEKKPFFDRETRFVTD